MNEDTWTVEHSANINHFSVPAAEVTRLLGLEPSRALDRGDARPECGGRPARTSAWIYKAPKENISTEAMNERAYLGMEDLIRLMHERREAIHTLCPPGKLWFNSVVISRASNIAGHLPARSVRQLADLGAEWGLSTWHIGPTGSVADWFLDADDPAV